MTKYREILRLTALGLSQRQRNIIQSIGVSQKTIVKVQTSTGNAFILTVGRNLDRCSTWEA